MSPEERAELYRQIEEKIMQALLEQDSETYHGTPSTMTTRAAILTREILVLVDAAKP